MSILHVQGTTRDHREVPVFRVPTLRLRPRLALAALSIGLLLPVPTAAPASATPPGIVPVGLAQLQLDELTVAPETSSSGYSRSLFPHWITISGACNTRETVLRRDGTNVAVNSSCAATGGNWSSPYDGRTWNDASDVDIDHVVPLSEAWRSGAASWSTDTRRGFANDLTRPQLIAVTDDVNQAKGDKDPASWKPPLASYHCTYSRMWIATKHHWNLTVQTSEKAALQNMLDTCS
jgi:hypothetical protein